MNLNKKQCWTINCR